MIVLVLVSPPRDPPCLVEGQSHSRLVACREDAATVAADSDPMEQDLACVVDTCYHRFYPYKLATKVPPSPRIEFYL